MDTSTSEDFVNIPRSQWAGLQILIANQITILKGIAVVLESQQLAHPSYAANLRESAARNLELLQGVK